MPTVSLVGYTNAGKSTLMNALTAAGVLVEDKLFATLDTRTLRWKFNGGGNVLLSDTVGFIRDLPPALVASFKATLEEARQADLLLHVVDASSPDAERQIQAVKTVLADSVSKTIPRFWYSTKRTKFRIVRTSTSSRPTIPSRLPSARPGARGLIFLNPGFATPSENAPSRPRSKSGSVTDGFWPTWRNTPRFTTGPTTPTGSASIAIFRDVAWNFSVKMASMSVRAAHGSGRLELAPGGVSEQVSEFRLTRIRENRAKDSQENRWIPSATRR